MRSYIPAFLSIALLVVSQTPEAEGKSLPQGTEQAASGTHDGAQPDSSGKAGSDDRGFFGGPSGGGGGGLFQDRGPSSLPYIIGAGAVGVAAGKALLDKKHGTEAGVIRSTKSSASLPVKREPPNPGRKPHDHPGQVSPPETTPEEKPSTPPEAPEPGTLILVSTAAALSILRSRRRGQRN